MSKITFRADDDLVEQLESLDASKSEAMRDALRSYLEDDETGTGVADSERNRDQESATEELVRELVDERLAERLREATSLEMLRANSREREAARSPEPQDVNVTISLEGAAVQSDEQSSDKTVSVREPVDDSRSVNRSRDGTTTQTNDGGKQCSQCGDHLNGDHVYCPNCGEKASRRLFCDCGDEIRSDWSFCPGCGRRTPAADVLESDGTQY